ncbi:AraC family transcriptional regulator [Cyclobacterium plantarum]|uniref:AraC family transcriptional regulator n=1 Tax=Cyclobacterium plantarum TaxID=2716263 RepID=UPI003F6F40C3
MKPSSEDHLQKITSYNIIEDDFPHNIDFWQYHQDVKLIHIKEGKYLNIPKNGQIGTDNDKIILIGPGLSHYWKLNKDRLISEEKFWNTEIKVLQFRDNFWGEEFLDIPENQALKEMLNKAKKGLVVSGATKDCVAKLLGMTCFARGPKRIMLLIEILTLIAQSNEISEIAPEGEDNFWPNGREDERIRNVIDFTHSNYKRKISLKEVADLVHLSPQYFCKFFKRNAGITYTTFLNEIRIGHACRLLVKKRVNIYMVAIESGYHNFGYFYKCFNKITGISPCKYQQLFLKNSRKFA